MNVKLMRMQRDTVGRLWKLWKPSYTNKAHSMTFELQKNSKLSLPLSAESMAILGFIYIRAKAWQRIQMGSERFQFNVHIEPRQRSEKKIRFRLVQMNLYEANGLRYNNIMTFSLPSKSSAVRGTPNSLLIEIIISAVGNSTLRTASRSLDCFDNYNSAHVTQVFH